MIPTYLTEFYRANLPPNILTQLKLAQEHKNQIAQLQEQVKLNQENKEKENKDKDLEKQVANLTKENKQLKTQLEQQKKVHFCHFTSDAV